MIKQGVVPYYADAILASSLPKREELAKLVRPTIYLHTHPIDDGELDTGASHLGGIPDLPPTVTWPTWKGVPQAFIAQINLSELPDHEERHLLPEDGFLFFFYDSLQSTFGTYASDRGSFAIFFSKHNDIGTTKHYEYPKHPEAVIFQPARMTFHVGMSEPGWEHPVLEHLGLSLEDRFQYSEVVQTEKERHVDQGVLSLHQILGHASPLQYSLGWD